MSKFTFLNGYGINLSRKSSLIENPPMKQNSNAKKVGSFVPNMEEMKQVFDKYDRNKDGKISKDEYKAILRAINGDGMITQGEATKYFAVADKDGDGFIDFMEFMEVHNNRVRSKDIESAFRVFDKDGDGKICAIELMDVLKRMGENYSFESCKKMISRVDSDGDGFINLSEFITMMTRSINLITK